MAKVYTEQSFPSTYKDDFKDSDNYHRILFNSGRALQARELTQMQTIIQQEVARFGRNIFKEGASVNPGGATCNPRYEFIKLNTSTNTLPTPVTSIVGNEFTGQTSGVKVRVLEVVIAEGSDPATLYVEYTGTSAAASSSVPIRVTAGEDLTDGSDTLTVQSTNTVANPCVGQGTQFSNASGDFFVRGHFVFASPQSVIISKYTTNPSVTMGFVVTEDIVTVDDFDALYDNQGATPNRSSPGADRYRIKLTLTDGSTVTDENFVFYSDVLDGKIVETVTGTDSYNKINELMATRTKEESGNYIVSPFDIDFSTDSENDTLDFNISAGNAYVDGYRANRNSPFEGSLTKPRTTQTLTNEVVGINYGNYFICDTLEGNLGTNTLAKQNLSTSTTNPAASIIGTCRVRSVEEDGANFRVYLFDIQMNSGQVLRNVKTLGTTTNNFAKPVLLGGKAIPQETLQDGLVFTLPRNRPRTISDVDFEVQRIVTGTSSGSGTLALAALTVVGETFVNTGQWICVRNSNGVVRTGTTFSGSGSSSVTISGLENSVAYTIYAKVNKAQPSVRVKQLISNATKTGALKTVGTETFLHLGKADISRVVEIKATNANGRDVSDEFIIDNGQRPNYYGPGRIIRASTSSITGNIYVKFDYFQHNTGDVFAVNSYSGQVDYSKIPFLDNENRDAIPLRDAIDFRPSTPDSGLDFTVSGAVINEIPTNGDIFQADVDYYLPRADKIVLTQEAELVHITGEPGFSRPMPATPEGTLPLFELEHNAYGINADDLGLRMLKYKRFTMQDINRLEEKLDNLKEQVSLSFLEVATDNIMVLDSDGIQRTKSGIFADNFSDTNMSDRLDPNHQSTIHQASKVMTSQSVEQGINLVYDSDKSSSVIRKGDNIYLNYGHTLAVRQNKISGTENVNPFAVVSGRGKITLSPKSDWWFETQFTPNKVIHETVERNTGINNLGEFTRPAPTFIAGPGFGVNFDFGGVGNEMGQGGTDNGILGIGDFLNFGWFGINVNNPQSFRDEDATFESQTTHPARGRRKQSTTFSKRTVVGSSVSTRVIGTRRVDLQFLPFMRSRKVFFKAEGLRPETRYFPFFSGKKVDSWCREESYEFSASQGAEYGRIHSKATSHPEGSSNLVTDTNGVVEGSFFIPSTTAFRFKAGKREFKLLDIDINQNGAALSRAITHYTSQGEIETRTRDVVSTRTVEVETQKWNEVVWIDPLAQSFRVPEGDGIFLTKVQTYFKTKDSKIQVECQIREMVNGHPASDSFMASKFLSPNSVAVPSSQTQTAVLNAPTTFEFDEPIYLKPSTEYCIVLLSDSVNYNAYVGETYAFELGSTEKRIDRQPSMGSLFKSQNGTTWEADQTKDMAFKIFKANFSTAGGTIILENGDSPIEPLINNPFLIISGNGRIYCRHPNHGFQTGDIVVIAGVSGGSGLTAANINGSKTVIIADGFGFTFLASNSDTATASGRLGGNGVTATKQIEFDAVIPKLESVTPKSTTMVHRAKFTTGKSFAAVSGSQTRYIKDGTFDGDYELGSTNRFNAPKLIANAANETAELGSGERSVTFQLSLDTTNNDVSPVVDMQRCGLGFITNRIDNQSSTAVNGFNVPYAYVAETNARGGSSMSKHITVPVTLANDAVGLKVLVAAMRPAAANFDLYYRTANEGDNIFRTPWTLANDTQEGTVAPDEKNFREYKYLIGKEGGDVDAFIKYQLKIVMRSSNSSTPPVFKDLRAIALGN